MESDPSSARNRFKLAVVYHHNGQSAEALAELEKTLALDPRFDSAYIERGTIHQEQAQYEKAIRDYTAAIEIGNTDPAVLEMRAECYRLAGRFADARQDAHRLIKMRRYLSPELRALLDEPTSGTAAN